MSPVKGRSPAASRQVRLSHNLESYDTRTKGAAHALEKLAEKGFFKITPIKKVGDTISADGPCPGLYISVYIVPLGGTEKTDKPRKVPIVGDSGSPHVDVKDSFEINELADTEWSPRGGLQQAAYRGGSASRARTHAPDRRPLFLASSRASGPSIH